MGNAQKVLASASKRNPLKGKIEAFVFCGWVRRSEKIGSRIKQPQSAKSFRKTVGKVFASQPGRLNPHRSISSGKAVAEGPFSLRVQTVRSTPPAPPILDLSEISLSARFVRTCPLLHLPLLSTKGFVWEMDQPTGPYTDSTTSRK